MKIVRIALYVLGGLLLANALLLLPVINPTIGWYMQVGLSGAMLLYAVLFKKIPRKIHVIAMAAFAIPVVFASFLAIYGNINRTTHEEDVIIVLGAGVRDETVSRVLAHRLNAAQAYWEQNPQIYIVVTGGLGNRATITEAEASARYLQARGVPRERIILEDRSTSTYENLIFTQEILQMELFPDGFTAVVVSNDFHIYRAHRLARQVGMDATTLGARTDWFMWPVNYLREMTAVVNAWLNNPLTRQEIPL